MEHNSVGWFEIYVDDMQRAVTFYQQVLAVNLEELASPVADQESGLKMMAFPSSMEKPGAAGALVKMQGLDAGGNSTIIYFICDDCATEASRVNEAGGSIFKSKMSIGEYGLLLW